MKTMKMLYRSEVREGTLQISMHYRESTRQTIIDIYVNSQHVERISGYRREIEISGRCGGVDIDTYTFETRLGNVDTTVIKLRSFSGSVSIGAW